MSTSRLLLCALLSLPACGVHSAVQQSQRYTSLGEYRRAFEVLDAARAEMLLAGDTPPAEFEAAFQAAQKRHLLERARWRIFSDREDAALADLAALLELEPEHAEAAQLRDRAIYKKAVKAVQEGDEFLLRKDLQGALAAYLRAEALLPGFEPAVDGSERVRVSLAGLTARAQSQFLEAVRKLPEFRFVEVRWHSEIALANEPDRADAEKLRQRARIEIAAKALQRGRECLAKDHFGAALVEFRNARKLDPSLPGIDEQIAQVERELDAGVRMEKAQVAMRSGRFDLAREHLGKAFEESTMSRGEISELMLQTRRREGEARYQAARDLEILGRKSEALAAFEALVKEWPEGVGDEKARVDGLRLDVESAAREWAAAEAAEQAGDAAAALLHYEAAMQFYAGWRDGAARIERLKAAIQAGGDGDAGWR
ncbi:MAG: hypothetical protein KF830_16210 [Planctomycetes bacterium]|nr:hypothetical protein [Planctomycetota bacterium]